MKDLLTAAGKLSTAARNVVGGREITVGQNLPPINVYSLSLALEKLRIAVDEYDAEIIKLMDKK